MDIERLLDEAADEIERLESKLSDKIDAALGAALDKSHMYDLSEEELKLAHDVFMREWAKLYPEPCNHPSLPLAHAITAVLERRAATQTQN